MNNLEVGDRVKYNWDYFIQRNGYYPNYVSEIRKWYKKNKRHYITKVEEEIGYEYVHHYTIDNYQSVNRNAVIYVKTTLLDRIIFKLRFGGVQ